MNPSLAHKLIKIHPVKTKFSNGLTLLYLHTKEDPISAGHLFLPELVVNEPEEIRGVSTLLWSLFLKGSQKRSAKKMAEDLESLGAYASAGATHDYSSVSFYSTSDTFKKTLDIVCEALFLPAFYTDDVQREKTALLAAIRAKEENIFTVTHEQCNQALYKDHPYAFPPSGLDKTVSHLKPNHLFEWHKKTVVPNQAILSIASSIPFKEFLPAFEKYFGPNSWEPALHSWKGRMESTSPPTEKISLSKDTSFEQAYLMLGFPACSVLSPDYIPLKILNGVLGGGMSARLFQSLREKQGLAYDVGTFYPSKMRGSGFYFYMGLQKSRLSEARHGIQKEIDRIQNEPISMDDLTQIKNYIKGTFILDHQTNSQRANYLGWWQTLGLGSDFDCQYNQEIDSVTSSHLQTIAKKYFNQPCVTIQTVPKTETKVQVSG